MAGSTDPGYMERAARRKWWQPASTGGWVILALIIICVGALLWVGFNAPARISTQASKASSPSTQSTDQGAKDVIAQVQFIADQAKKSAEDAKASATAAKLSAMGAQSAASAVKGAKAPAIAASKPVRATKSPEKPKGKSDDRKKAEAGRPIPVVPSPMLAPASPVASAPSAVMVASEPDYIDRITLWMDTVPSITFFTEKVGPEKPWTRVNVDPCTPPVCTMAKGLARTNWPALLQAWFVDAETRIPAATIMITPGQHARPMWGTWGKTAFTFHPNVVAAWPGGKSEPAKHWWVTVGPRGERPKKVLTFHVVKVHACGNYHGWVEEVSVPPMRLEVKLPPGRMPLGALPVVTCPE